MIINFSSTIYKKLKEIALYSDKAECGGVLLGNIKENGIYYITDYIESKAKSDEFSLVFSSQQLIEEYMKKEAVEIIGLWHSHILGCDYLSNQDKRILNYIQSIKNKPIISVLLVVESKKVQLIFHKVYCQQFVLLDENCCISMENE